MLDNSVGCNIPIITDLIMYSTAGRIRGWHPQFYQRPGEWLVFQGRVNLSRRGLGGERSPAHLQLTPPHTPHTHAPHHYPSLAGRPCHHQMSLQDHMSLKIPTHPLPGTWPVATVLKAGNQTPPSFSKLYRDPFNKGKSKMSLFLLRK